MFRPPLAAFSGGVLCLALSLVLRGFAHWCWRRPYRKTETWLLILQDDRPPAGIAQRVVGVALQSAYLWFARQSAVYGAVLLAASIALSFMGVEYLEAGGLNDDPGNRAAPFLASLKSSTPRGIALTP
ncbi:MAG: hypothetical protein RIC16_08155 [Rhodospirillales bacterium]